MRRDDGAERMQQHGRERGDGDGEPERIDGDRGTGAVVYGGGKWKHQSDGDGLAVHIFVYAAADDGGAESQGGNWDMHKRNEFE